MNETRQYLLADGTEIFPVKRRGAPRGGNPRWVHSYVSFVDGSGTRREVTAAEFNKMLKRGKIRTVVLDPEIARLRQMNATTGFFCE